MSRTFSIVPLDAEGRTYWIDEKVGEGFFGRAAAEPVEIVLPNATKTFFLTRDEWMASTTKRTRPSKSRRLPVPAHFFSPITFSGGGDGTTTSDSMTVSSDSLSPPLPPPPIGVMPYIFPENGVAAGANATADWETFQEATRQYISLTADLRIAPLPAGWRRVCSAYPLILGQAHLRPFALGMLIRLVLAPSLWLWPPPRAPDDPPVTFHTGIKNALPDLIEKALVSEQQIVRQQCLALSPSEAQRLFEHARAVSQPRALTHTQLLANGRVQVDFETRLLSGLSLEPGVVDFEANVAAVAILPMLHARSLRKDLVESMGAAFKHYAAFDSERQFIASLGEEQRRLWLMAREWRTDLKRALDMGLPDEFFIGQDRYASSQMDIINARIAKRQEERASGKWFAPAKSQDRTERQDRVERLRELGTLDIEDLFKDGPPCIQSAMASVRTTRQLKNDERRAVATWVAAMKPKGSLESMERIVYHDRLPLRGAPTTGEQKIRTALKNAQPKQYAPYCCTNILNDDKVNTSLRCPYAPLVSDALKQPESTRATNWMMPAIRACGSSFPGAPPFLFSPVDYLLFTHKV